MAENPQGAALQSLARAHLLLIATTGTLLSFTLAIWPVSQLHREIERLDVFVAECGLHPQRTLEQYRPRFFADQADNLIRAMTPYGNFIFYEAWVQEKTVGAMVRALEIRLPSNFETKTPEQIALTLEHDNLAQVAIPSNLVGCTLRLTRPSILIIDLTDVRRSPNSTRARFSTGLLVQRAGEPPNPGHAVSCEWTTTTSSVPPLDPGSFAGFFPLLSGPYSSRPLGDLRQLQPRLREQVLSQSLEFGGVPIDRRFAVWAGIAAISLTLIFMQAFALRLAPNSDTTLGWIAVVPNTWARVFSVLTIAVIPTASVAAAVYGSAQLGLIGSAAVALPVLAIALLLLRATFLRSRSIA